MVFVRFCRWYMAWLGASQATASVQLLFQKIFKTGSKVSLNLCVFTVLYFIIILLLYIIYVITA